MEIKTEMAGNLWKLLVSVGDTVTEGQEVAILESMKMEIPISTKQAGTVKEIRCEESEFLNKDDIVVVLE